MRNRLSADRRHATARPPVSVLLCERRVGRVLIVDAEIVPGTVVEEMEEVV